MDSLTRTKATALLRDDHARAREIYRKYGEAQKPGDRGDLAEDFLRELEIHSFLEERLAYPKLAEQGREEALVKHFGEDHGEIRRLISQYRLCLDESGEPSPQGRDLLARIMHAVQRHVVEEEAQGLPVLEADPIRDEELGAEMARLKRKLSMFPPFYRWIEVGVPVS